MVRFYLLAALVAAASAARLEPSADVKIAAHTSQDSADYEELTPQAQRDKILALPGFENSLASNHFGGYVTVDEDHGRQLYYYFVESERDPANDPVVVWMNGGPGCSSFDGFVYEQGPFTYDLVHRQGGPGAEVAGYVVEYAHGLSYATVKGAGHMVPETNPREALALFQRFIDGKSLA
ncbi:Serine carboxypeptidase 1 [Tetrabaena socialis]|uniref:Serine carboxypeptidase 1 n=1 Tax=Tetrabaena socialis TaxID=47790 RepID=A0A2J8A3E4_9CHLO|nr:Serine carboxypeptidase 1 [Tetrabaena socialis]|eukprot:PNH07041.1 Serine carboxypeptidase 1 [Tetrabaena socialis]